MKKLLGMMVAVSLVGCVSLTPTKEPMPEVSQVIDVPNKSKDEIFEGSRIWMAQTFKSANNVIQYQDKETGSIVGKGNIQYPCDGFTDCGAFGNDKVNFTIKIDTKDNKARVSISDITRTSLTRIQGAYNTNIGQEFPITLVEHQKKISVKLNDIANQYKTAITSNQSVNSDW